MPRIIVPDFTNEFVMIGRLARYFKGGLSIPDMMKMTFKDMKYWYDIYINQLAEESIIRDHAKKDKPIPKGYELMRLVKNKIKQWSGKDGE